MKVRSRMVGTLLCAGTVMAAAAVVAVAQPAEAVIGGTPSDPAAYPYFVYLESSTEYCGGSVIEASWVLTAAHCVDNDVTDPDGVTVAIRQWRFDNPVVRMTLGPPRGPPSRSSCIRCGTRPGRRIRATTWR